MYIPLQPKNEICRSSAFHAMPQFHIQLVNMTTNCLLSYLVSQEHWLHDYQYGESHQEHLHSVPSFQKKKKLNYLLQLALSPEQQVSPQFPKTTYTKVLYIIVLNRRPRSKNTFLTKIHSILLRKWSSR